MKIKADLPKRLFLIVALLLLINVICLGQGQTPFEFTICDELKAYSSQLKFSVVVNEDTLTVPKKKNEYQNPFSYYDVSELSDSLELTILMFDGKYEYSTPISLEDFNRSIRYLCLKKSKHFAFVYYLPRHRYNSTC